LKETVEMWTWFCGADRWHGQMSGILKNQIANDFI
jgi:hypothetical protein